MANWTTSCACSLVFGNIFFGNGCTNTLKHAARRDELTVRSGVPARHGFRNSPETLGHVYCCRIVIQNQFDSVYQCETVPPHPQRRNAAECPGHAEDAGTGSQDEASADLHSHLHGLRQLRPGAHRGSHLPAPRWLPPTHWFFRVGWTLRFFFFIISVFILINC